MVDECTAMWGRPPNWLLVDYYNRGSFNGSVFEVAAQANGVEYDRRKCCAVEKSTRGAAGWIQGAVHDAGKRALLLAGCVVGLVLW
jgi:hypothetical protein